MNQNLLLRYYGTESSCFLFFFLSEPSTAAHEVKCLNLPTRKPKRLILSSFRTMTLMQQSIFTRWIYPNQFRNLSKFRQTPGGCVEISARASCKSLCVITSVCILVFFHSPARWAPGSTPVPLHCSGPALTACPVWTGPAAAHGAPPGWWSSPLRWNRCSLGPAEEREQHQAVSVRGWSATAAQFKMSLMYRDCLISSNCSCVSAPWGNVQDGWDLCSGKQWITKTIREQQVWRHKPRVQEQRKCC